MRVKLILFSVHLFIMFAIAGKAFVKSIHSQDIDDSSISVLDYLNRIINSDWIYPYTALSGIESGYGFYGSKVSTSKFFTIEVYDKDARVTGNLFIADAFRTKSGYSRFQTLMSKLYNFITQTEDMKKLIVDAPLGQNGAKERNIALREIYVEKLLRHIALKML